MPNGTCLAPGSDRFLPRHPQARRGDSTDADARVAGASCAASTGGNSKTSRAPKPTAPPFDWGKLWSKSDFTFLINDQYVAQVEDDRVRQGFSGIAIEMSSGDNAVFEFDNFVRPL